VASLTEVAVPDIGDFSDIPIVAILVSVGDTVAVEDPLVEIESDKATLEVPAPQAGVVKELKVSVGDTVSEGTVLLMLEPSDGGDGGEAPKEDPEPKIEEKSEEVAEESSEKEEPEPEEPEQAPEPETGSPKDDDVHASPIARRVARDLGVDLASVSGSGRGGRITKEDVEDAAAGGGTPAPAKSANAAPAPGEVQRIELSRIQKASAKNLQGAWQTIPHVTHHEDADITDLEAFRKQLNAEQSDVKVTMVALLLKATAATLQEFPRFASSLDGDELVIKPDLHIGFAADTPNGLVVPVVRDVAHKGILQLAGELTELSGKARAGKLSPKEMSGAVFTISSLGGIGGTGFTPIVNPPQVCVLGVVRSAMKPVWDGQEFQPRLMLPLSLSYDHRVIDGAAAARFCAHLAKVLADLRRVLL
jgi:pyruvate dehydrogenase E2 component (dihydrolipoamide acetyltransferase)